MEFHIANVPLLMVLLCKPPAAARRGRTQNSLEHKGAPDLSCQLPRWVADGQRKCVASSVSLPTPRSGHCPRSSVLAPSKSWHFRWGSPRELWHLRSWRTARVLARMARRHQRPTSCAIGVTCLRRFLVRLCLRKKGTRRRRAVDGVS